MNIEKYLILNNYLLSLFGVSDFRDLQQKLKDAPVGVDSDGRSHFVNALRSSLENLQKDKLPDTENDLKKIAFWMAIQN